MHPLLEKTLRDIHAEDHIEASNAKFAARSIASELDRVIKEEEPELLTRFGLVYEIQGIRAYFDFLKKNSSKAEKNAYIDFFRYAHECWRTLFFLSEDCGSDSVPGQLGLDIFKNNMPYKYVHADLSLALHMASAGLLAENVSNVRLDLQKFQLTHLLEGSWKEKIINGVVKAFILLCRKSNGWQDVIIASEIIENLRKLQHEFEDKYLNQFEEKRIQTIEAISLVGFYHLAQLITLTATYLRDGFPSFDKLKLQLERHYDQAKKAIKISEPSNEEHLSDLIYSGLIAIARNAIWTHVSHLGTNINKLVKLIADEGRPNPIIELWPSQQQALKENLLDTYKKAVLVEMPTSAGKTLLAKFAIIQSLTLNPEGTVVYIVPTRALVNQITMSLRSDFAPLKFVVEMAIPSYELNPTESALLSHKPNILVSTPEKLDLLIKSDHPSVDKLSIVISDEAHNLGEGSERAARLELLLGTIKREKSEVRFLLLSPFLPNGKEIVEWLGNEKALPPIKVNWKPSKKLVGAIYDKGRSDKRSFQFELLPSVDNYVKRDEQKFSFTVGSAINESSIKIVSSEAAKIFSKEGTVLILCRGRHTAEVRAKYISEIMPKIDKNDLLEAAINFIASEIGGKTCLVECLEKKIAFHHSGMSHEVRWLIERLISIGIVNIVCGTTTLAQGIDFPIKTVIIETLTKGKEKKLSYEEFWNIAGRAGRAAYDTMGIICFPFSVLSKRKDTKKYLQGEAKEITSYLASLIVNAEKIGSAFNMQTVRQWPQFAELMKYLAHAMRISGSQNMADELDEILRGSFAYYSFNQDHEDSESKDFINLCANYLNSISKRKNILSLADKTGFTTPSVFAMLSALSSNSSLRNENNWHPDTIFGTDIKPLKERIEVIAALPEMGLSDGKFGKFDSERVASILIDWVKGESLINLTSKYSLIQNKDNNERVGEFSRYLYGTLISKAAWGVGALEGICIGNKTDRDEDYNYISSMIFFGVKSKEAVWFRMAGVPRSFANELSNLWIVSKGGRPNSYQEMRDWVSGLQESEWTKVISKNSPLTPKQSKLIWENFFLQ